MSEKTITEFLSNEYKDFSLYVIENRALPSCIDSFKPVQRKIIHISNSIWKIGSEKSLKVFQLSGAVANLSFYHHGSASLESAIINMAQRFKNNMPLLEEIGQFGSLRSPKPGAARYIGTKLNKNFRLLYKDFDLIDYKEEEGEKIEPYFFLPIIPTVLVNGSSGISVGFATNILNRNPMDILICCENILKNKKIINPLPYNQFFKGTYTQDIENKKKWIIRGSLEVINSTSVKITELPPSMTFEKYEIFLDDMIEKKIIVSYDDNCKDDINYTIKFTREILSKYDIDKLIKLLNLEEYETENYTTLDEFGKLKIFNNVEEILRYFVSFRLSFYDKRKKFIIDKMNYDLNIINNRSKFIKAILDGRIEVKNAPKDDIIKSIEILNIDKIDDGYDYLLRMPIWSLTKEVFEKLKEDYKTKKEEISKFILINPMDMYLNDLSELKKKLK